MAAPTVETSAAIPAPLTAPFRIVPTMLVSTLIRPFSTVPYVSLDNRTDNDDNTIDNDCDDPYSITIGRQRGVTAYGQLRGFSRDAGCAHDVQCL